MQVFLSLRVLNAQVLTILFSQVPVWNVPVLDVFAMTLLTDHHAQIALLIDVLHAQVAV